MHIFVYQTLFVWKMYNIAMTSICLRFVAIIGLNWKWKAHEIKKALNKSTKTYQLETEKGSIFASFCQM